MQRKFIFSIQYYRLLTVNKKQDIQIQFSDNGLRHAFFSLYSKLFSKGYNQEGILTREQCIVAEIVYLHIKIKITI